jgi:hypothetical protein
MAWSCPLLRQAWREAAVPKTDAKHTVTWVNKESRLRLAAHFATLGEQRLEALALMIHADGWLAGDSG